MHCHVLLLVTTKEEYCIAPLLRERKRLLVMNLKGSNGRSHETWHWWKGCLQSFIAKDITLISVPLCSMYNDITITHQKCHIIIWLSVFKYSSNHCIMWLYVQIGSEHNYYVKITCHISIYIIVINYCNLYIYLHNFIY